MNSPGSSTLTQLSLSELVLILREELKLKWKAGDRVPVEALLLKWAHAKIPEEGTLDLIYQEIVVREEAGEQPTLDDYQRRFPELATPLKRQFELHEILKKCTVWDDPKQKSGSELFEQLALAATGKPFAPGTKIRHYDLQEKVGEGGMGVVFKAMDSQLQRTVALKIMKGQEYASSDQLHRFKAEAELLAKLQHPNIVQVFEISDHEGTSFFAMEYVAGTTLKHEVSEKPLIPAEAARLVHLLAEAMNVVHLRGIIHRDLKPSNILLSREQVPKISDFGLARQGQSEWTVAGVILGTPSYMAPEQALGQRDRIGPLADIYALGAILFELLTGRAPFRGASVAQTLQMVVNNDPPTPRRLQPGIPRDLETICMKCLNKDPAKRFHSAQDLADDLQRFLRLEPIHARPAGWLENLGKWARRETKVASWIAVAVLTTLIGLVSVFYMWHAERQARQDAEKRLYFGLVLTANVHLSKGKFAWAAETLDRCPPAFRDWEWFHLRHRCREAIPLQVSILGLMGTAGQSGPLLAATLLYREANVIDLPNGVISLAAHPTQSSMVAGCQDGTIAIVNDGRVAKVFPEHFGAVNWITFVPDGSVFFSGGDGANQIIGRNWASGEKTITFDEHQGPIACIAAHPHEPWIASTTFNNPQLPHADDGSVFVWQRQTGKRIYTLQNHTKTVVGLAFHPSGKLLASGSHDKTITLWDCQTGNIIRVLKEHRAPISSIAFSPDGTLLASSASAQVINSPGDEEIFVWHTATGKLLHRMEGHDERIFTLAFAPSGKRLATAGKDRLVKLWDLQNDGEVLTLVGHQGWVPTLAFDRQGSLLTGSLDRSIRLWKISDHR